MKTRLALILLAACAAPAVGYSQAPDPKPDADQPGKQLREKMRDKFLDNLPPEIRARFEAAREKAMEDPKVKELRARADAAGGEFRAAVRDAMLKADPGLAEILKQRTGNKPGKEADKKQPDRPALAQLSEGDRQKLLAAREKAKNDPDVQAADAKKKAATTPEDRRAAAEEFHKSMRSSLLKADPSLEPILDQIKPATRPQKPNSGPGDAPEMGGQEGMSSDSQSYFGTPMQKPAQQ